MEHEEKTGTRQAVSELILGLMMLILVAVIHITTQGNRFSLIPYRAVDGIPGREENTDERTGSSGYCVVLDAGHGASDPGKIGCNQVNEKDINLLIVQKLKYFLEEQDVKVILTRESDAPLYDTGAANKKMSDMKARVSLIESTEPDLVVSIHQNSYHEPEIYGPQVFYYKASEKGKRAAEILQASFDGLEEIDNKRASKANDNYYLLLHTSVPMVIAECGFLSNPKEADLLIQESYQEKVAWVLHLGILQYLNEQGTGGIVH